MVISLRCQLTGIRGLFTRSSTTFDSFLNLYPGVKLFREET